MRNRRAKAIEELREFIAEVNALARVRADGDHGRGGEHRRDEDHDRRPRLDPATAALWIAEAQSIITTLMTP